MAAADRDGDYVASNETEEKQQTPESSSTVVDGQKHGGDAEKDEATEAGLATKRVTRPRTNQKIVIDDTDTESEVETRRRTRGATKPKEKTPPKKKQLQLTTKKQEVNGKAAHRSKHDNETDSDDDDDTPGEYVHIEVGDCVLLDSGDPDNHYVALVSHVQYSQNRAISFTAQWYYKPEDVRDEVLAIIEGGVLDQEVFLTPHKDKNHVDAVVGVCHVVSPEEYEEIQREIKRGFREKGDKPYYVCRFKYYPGRSPKKALEIVKNNDIRSGLGPQKPKIGESFQVEVPKFVKPPSLSNTVTDKERKAESSITTRKEQPPKGTPSEKRVALVPWAAIPKPREFPRQIWSPLVVEKQTLIFREFQEQLERIRFAVGNIVTIYRNEPKAMGHVRCIILKYIPSDSIQVCVSTGHIKTVLKSEICSPLKDDVAMQHFYNARFNLCQALQDCTSVILGVQQTEREAFKKELHIFAQIAQEKKEALASKQVEDTDSNRKRRK